MTTRNTLRDALRATTWTMGASARIPVARRDEWCDMADRLFFAELAVRGGIEDFIADRVVDAIERVVTDQALNTPLNREALVAVVRDAANSGATEG